MALDSTHAARAAVPASRSVGSVMLASFTLALFSSAFLIFWVEPLFARMLLPRAGGSQAVWNTCLVFFQLSLLVGYTYAHLLTRLLPLAGQAIVHLGVIALGTIFLPVALDPEWAPPVTGSPVLAIFVVLTLTLGGPFFALSANAPLLQHWFSHSRHAQAGNPYMLYAASNAGSLASLLAYPFLIEPSITLGQQAHLWAFCYGLLCLSVAIAAALVIRSGADASAETAVATTKLDGGTRLTWLVYAALPSSLLVGLTSYVSTDIASFPLLWIAPLAVYLLTFVLTFAARPLLPHAMTARLLPVGLVLAAAGFSISATSLVLAVAVHFLAFFLIAIACHGELARLKPPVDRLTEFYFWLSLGGVVGGAITALVSPLVFESIVEYPLALALTCILRPGATRSLAPPWQTLALAIAVGLIVGEPLLANGATPSLAFTFALIAAVAALGLRLRGQSGLLLLASALLLFSHAGRNLVIRASDTEFRARSFYGAYRVTRDARGHRMMFHGTTYHGLELVNAAHPEPMLYYGKAGPLGDVMAAFGPRSHTVGAIGLGVGSVSCYATPSQSWTFYELDALVYQLAAKSGLFRSLPECAPEARVILGDGRLTLAKAPAGSYDLLILDAFSSDSIPIHLITREAFTGYGRVLAPHGVLVIHMTNRHFDLAPIIAKLADASGFVAYERSFQPSPGADIAPAAASRWMVLARDEADLEPLAHNTNWAHRRAQPSTKLWTDDFANILSALR